MYAKTMNKINSLAIFCGSSLGNSQQYIKSALKMGEALVDEKISLVYGGGNIGLMGTIATYVFEHGTQVIGVLPQKLNLPQVVNKKVETKRIIVETMHERKAMMYELSDGFIALPGGIGTFEEFFEAYTWLQLGYHRKPVGLLNVNGFYDELLSFLNNAVKSGFMKKAVLDILVVEEDPYVLIDRMRNINLKLPQKV
jgi:uncharacterized protein (TIGR00730 family)